MRIPTRRRRATRRHRCWPTRSHRAFERDGLLILRRWLDHRKGEHARLSLPRLIRLHLLLDHRGLDALLAQQPIDLGL